jgi:hypothetical protein
MPIEIESQDEKRLSMVTQVDGVLLQRARDLGREVVLLDGEDSVAVGDVFKRFLNCLKKVCAADEEPMINIAGFCRENKWRLAIFPRRKHRPDAFFREGDSRVVVSPGAIDMGGVLITPVEKDFDRLDAASVEGIYGEVSLEGEKVDGAINALAGC